MTKEIISNELAEELHAWKVEANFNLQREATYWAHAYGGIIRSHFKGELTQEDEIPF